MTQKFEITSGSLVCSDPCYTTDVWCMGIMDNVKKGTWLAHSNIEIVEGGWGERNVDLTIHHADYKIDESAWVMLPGTFGVDSGQFGFFDRDHYRKAASVKQMAKVDFGDDYDRTPEDEWYRACSKLTLETTESWGVLPHGVVSSSGIGDGSYDVYGIKDTYSPNHEYIAFRVVFIYTDEEDDLDEWEENKN